MTARYPLALLLIVLAAGIWSAIHPHDILTWFLEVFPVMIALPLLALTFKRLPLTPLVYTLIAVHCIILIIGGHYTYALTPIGDWMRDILHTQRNPYDRLGHFAQGAVPALVIRELLLRTSPLRQGKWLFALIFFCCMGISACYELIEWAAAAADGSEAVAFLGTQGDVWDTQQDMLMAGIGALFSLLCLTPFHNRQLKALHNIGATR